MKYQFSKNLLAFTVALLFCTLMVTPILALSEKSQSQIQIDTLVGNISTGDPVYQLLIVAPKQFVQPLQPLVYHKYKMGITTLLVTLDEIYEHMYWYGRDPAEKIKYYIKHAVDHWGTEYVLLVGGKKGQLNRWHVPVRYVHMECDWEAEILSDLYFADIYDSQGNFSSWDTDDDGLFGEWYMGEYAEDQPLDLYPDVAVGRLPCRNRFEVRLMVRKIIKYETTTAGKPWFWDILVLAGDTYPEAHNPLWEGYEGEYYGDRAIENMTGFTATRLYTSDGSLADKQDVIDAFKKGYGFVYFVGHGSPRNWGNNLPNGTGFVRGLTTQEIHRLRNKDELPICVVSGCHNCQFDVSVFKWFNETLRWHQEYVPECWGWRMTRKIGGGSVATLGCTALGYTKEDKELFQGGINELEVEFFKQYGQQNITVLGETWKAAVSWYLDTYSINWDTPGLWDSWIDAQVVESWILFGDPSLQIGGYPY